MGRRRRGGADEAFTFDLEPDDGDEPVGRGHERRAEASTEPVRRAPDAARPVTASAGAPIVIDLDSALDSALDHSPEDALPDAPSSALMRRLRAQPRGRVLAAAAVVGVLAVGAAVVSTVVERNRETGLRGAPGGVLDLATEPSEAWALEGSARRGTGLIATMGRLVVVQDVDGLAAVDAESGRPRWRVGGDVGQGSCGPSPDYLGTGIRPYSTDLLVCVAADRGSDESVVAVIDGEGSVVSRRTVDHGDGALFPGVDGGLLTATWVDEADEPRGADVLIDPQSGSLTDGQVIEDGYDLEVRLEDAATGRVRWEQTVAFEPVTDPYLCARWVGASDDEARVDLRGGLSMGATPRMIWVSACGIDASFTPSGTRLDTPQVAEPGRRASELDRERVQPLVDGGFIVRWDTRGDREPSHADTLLRADGTVVREVDGDVLDPWATSGAGAGLHVLRGEGETVGVDRDGDELWRTDVPAVAVLVRTRDALVVADDTLHLVGIDPATGERLWRSEQPMGADDVVYDSAEGTVQSVFTDGRVMALVLPDWESSNRRWIAFDVHSGDQLWEREYVSSGWGAEFAVDGRIVRWSPTGLAGLG